MAKSSLKTFLAGKNPYQDEPNGKLKNANFMSLVIDTGTREWTDDTWTDGNDEWGVDVLDDGTAITYNTISKSVPQTTP
jgi:hypothetical protein